MITDELREYAETPDRFAPIPEGSSVTRFDDGRICVIQGTTWAGVSAPRFREEELDGASAPPPSVGCLPNSLRRSG